MSSTYSALCLAHDPAFYIGPDFTYDEANNLRSRDRLGEHQRCDIVIGRTSGALVELACLGRQLPGPTGCKGYHSGIEWVDVDWLRLLAVAAPLVPDSIHKPLTTRCWPLDRLNRLRNALSLHLTEQH